MQAKCLSSGVLVSYEPADAYTHARAFLCSSKLNTECVCSHPSHRQDQGTVAKLSAIDDTEQLYAVTTILPFANLDELDLSGLCLNSSEQWCALLEACSRCTGLRVLSLKGCGLASLGELFIGHI